MNLKTNISYSGFQSVKALVWNSSKSINVKVEELYWGGRQHLYVEDIVAWDHYGWPDYPAPCPVKPEPENFYSKMQTPTKTPHHRQIWET